MKMKLNCMYRTEKGFITPRSHFKNDKGLRYAIIEEVETDGRRFTIRHIVLDVKEIRKALNLNPKEGVTIE